MDEQEIPAAQVAEKSRQQATVDSLSLVLATIAGGTFGGLMLVQFRNKWRPILVVSLVISLFAYTVLTRMMAKWTR